MTRGDVVAAIGLALAPLYFFIYIPSVGWGDPGTAAYAAYEWANRGMSALLVVTVLTALIVAMRSRHRRTARVVLVAALLMLVGSVTEFWVFTEAPYKSVERGAAWSTFVVGGLLFLVSGFALAIRRAAVITGVT